MKNITDGEFQMTCQHCGFEVAAWKIGRQETCPKCGAALHCCLNCRFFAETASHQCREEQAEFVGDKQAANFCDYFDSSETGFNTKHASKEDALRKLDQLFKKRQ
jgi:predicted RNA-binding Zn-ribbon protein involved in translation (DUF1610 family)